MIFSQQILLLFQEKRLGILKNLNFKFFILLGFFFFFFFSQNFNMKRLKTKKKKEKGKRNPWTKHRYSSKTLPQSTKKRNGYFWDD
jgi:hypothetical protein